MRIIAAGAAFCCASGDVGYDEHRHRRRRGKHDARAHVHLVGVAGKKWPGPLHESRYATALPRRAVQPIYRRGDDGEKIRSL